MSEPKQRWLVEADHELVGEQPPGTTSAVVEAADWAEARKLFVAAACPDADPFDRRIRAMPVIGGINEPATKKRKKKG